ncbi:MAG: competence/damage-inducible protein A [Rikenellaceae bacterium]
MKATIITIGDEILIGQIVDTNAVFISQRLNSIGCVVTQRFTIGDGRQQIIDTIESAMATTDIVIVTGGLGPTKDDITKTTLAEMFGGEMVRSEMVAEHVKALIAKRGLEYNVLNQAQSMVPESCEVLFNAHGTAPGMLFERDGKVVISLPGVPFEMEHLIDDEVLPRLKTRYEMQQIVHRTLITAGVPESQLALQIEEWESALPSYLKLAYLPSYGRVRLRLSAYEVDGASVAEEIDRQFKALEVILEGHVLGYQGATIEEIVHNRLVESGATIAVAESCTGGAIATKFTAMSGASGYFMCGVVAYSNSSKETMLGVKVSTLEAYGAVSEQVACEMAEGVRLRSGADFGISTTGIAGPTGGSEEKPVGTVWFGVSTPERTFAVMKNCGTDRGQVIGRATAEAITLLKNEL